jgi:hypothetical protein
MQQDRGLIQGMSGEPTEPLSHRPASRTKESFVRWQNFRIQQFGAVQNLFLGLATGGIAFDIRTWFDSSTLFICRDKLILLFSLLCLTCSVVSGAWMAINRLLDFRITAQLSRRRRTNKTIGSSWRVISNLRRKVKALGKKTWCLLHWQIWSFGFGMAALLVLLFMIEL